MGPAAAVLLSLSTLCYCQPCRWDRPAVLDCSGAGLSALPSRLALRVAVLDLGRDALGGVAQLRLGGNRIRRLSLCLGGAGGPEPARPLTPDPPRRSGESLCASWAPDLQLLSAERNQLRRIPAGLGQSPSLRVLQLSGNKISAIRQQDLQNCTELRAVFLQHNEISAIDPSAFRDVGQLQVT
ncbi:LRC66 protein, partial [Atractosteus spatula]|nr:LRC66 protein [Atractosteus spatula]